MAELLFYNKPAPLARDKHQALRFNAQQGYGYASGVNAVPLSGNEFFPASRDYPVMFTESGSSFLPVALLSLTSGGHQLGQSWQGFYVPEFVKRYPFALAEDKSVVMIDESAPHFSETEGERLFDDAGNPSEFLQGILQYLNQLETMHRMTLEYTFALKVKGLLVRSDVEVKMKGSSLKLDDFFVVDTNEFHSALTEEEIVDWYHKGWLGWTYAHLHSIGAVSNLARRMVTAKG